jgi:hypothetical protein
VLNGYAPDASDDPPWDSLFAELFDLAYGNYWYPWFVRRLAERPANLWLLLRNLVSD